MSTSIPAAFAAATSATLEDPVSTVTITVAPADRAVSTAASERPCPSSRRDGKYGMTSTPEGRSASVRIASPVIPSASKSPNTRMRSRRSRALRTRSRKTPASGSRPGSWSPAAGSPMNRRSSSPAITPRAARSATTRGPRLRSRPASSSAEGTATVVGNTQRDRGASTASGCHAPLHHRSTRWRRAPFAAARRQGELRRGALAPWRCGQAAAGGDPPIPARRPAAGPR